MVLSVLVCLLQFETLSKLAVLSPGASHNSLGEFIAAMTDQVPFSTTDMILLLLVLIVVAFLLVLEVRWTLITSFLRSAMVTDRRTVGLLFVSSLVLVRYYAASGEFSWAGDAPQHLATAYMAARSMENGELPIWTFFIGNGSPYLQHYGFLFPYLVGFADLLFNDLFRSLKVVLMISHALSGIGMYLYVSRLCNSRRAGFIAGLGYVLCFWHLQQVLIMGRLPLGLYYCLLPWVFHFFEQVLLVGRASRGVLLGGLSISMLSFTHPAYGFYTCVILLLYAVVRLLLLRKHGCFKKMVAASLLYMVCGLLFSAYMNVGMWVESAFTNMSDFDFGLTDPDVSWQRLPGPTWHHVLVWSNYRFWLVPLTELHWYGGYLGLSLIVLALIALFAACSIWRSSRVRHYLPCLLMLLVVVSVLLAYRLPLLNSIHLIQVFNPSRYLLFVAFFLAASAGIGMNLILLSRPRLLSRSRWFTVLLLVLLADLGTTTFQQPYGKQRDISFLQQQKYSEREAMSGSTVPNYRAQWIAGGHHSAHSIARMVIDGKTPVPEVYHPGELPASEALTKPVMYTLRKLLVTTQTSAAFAVHPVRDLTINGLRLLNTRFVVSTTNPAGNALQVEIDNTPIIVAPRLASFVSEPTTQDELESDLGRFLRLAELDNKTRFRVKNGLRMVQEMGLDPVRSVCERILVSTSTSGDVLGTSPEVEVLEHRVAHHDVFLRVNLTEPGFARLAYAYYPFLQVRVDGEVVDAIETADRFIALKLDAGEHAIALEARLSPLRRSLIALALTTLAVVAIFAVREHRLNRAQ